MHSIHIDILSLDLVWFDIYSNNSNIIGVFIQIS